VACSGMAHSTLNTCLPVRMHSLQYVSLADNNRTGGTILFVVRDTARVRQGQGLVREKNFPNTRKLHRAPHHPHSRPRELHLSVRSSSPPQERRAWRAEYALRLAAAAEDGDHATAEVAQRAQRLLADAPPGFMQRKRHQVRLQLKRR